MELLEDQAAATPAGAGPVKADLPVAAALQQLGGALVRLVTVVEHGGLDRLGALELVEFMQEFERFRIRL